MCKKHMCAVGRGPMCLAAKCHLELSCASRKKSCLSFLFALRLQRETDADTDKCFLLLVAAFTKHVIFTATFLIFRSSSNQNGPIQHEDILHEHCRKEPANVNTLFEVLGAAEKECPVRWNWMLSLARISASVHLF